MLSCISPCTACTQISFISAGVCCSVIFLHVLHSSPSPQALCCSAFLFLHVPSPSSQACVLLSVFLLSHPFISGVCCSCISPILISLHLRRVVVVPFSMYCDSSPSSQACVVVYFFHVMHSRFISGRVFVVLSPCNCTHLLHLSRPCVGSVFLQVCTHPFSSQRVL